MSGINKKDVKSLLKILNAHMKSVAKERDKIDEMIEEFESLKDSCERAFASLEDARDCLSELV